MAFDYTNLYPDTSGNGGFTKSWNYTTLDSMATVSAPGYFNKVASRVGIGDNIIVAVVDAFDKSRTSLLGFGTLYVTGIANGAVTTTLSLQTPTTFSLNVVGVLPPPTGGSFQFVGANGTNTFIEVDAFGGFAGVSTVAANGTLVAPTKILANQLIGSFSSKIHDGVGYSTTVAALNFIKTAADASASDHGILAQLALTPAGSIVGAVYHQWEAGSYTINGATSGGVKITVPAVAGSGAWALPSATDTFVGRATSDTLTNKILTAPVINSPTGIVKGDVGLGNVANLAQIVSVKKQFFAASGTYTPSAGMAFCLIEAVGAGGGGGGGAGTVGNTFGAGGGGSGSYARLLATAATIGASQTVTVAAGGAGGTAGFNSGSAGGDSSVGTLCIGKGGSGGTGTSSAGGTGIGGAGGVAGTGDQTAIGAPGGNGFYNATANAIAVPAGIGGSSHFGGGAVSPSTGSGAQTGITATGLGGGGSGAFVNNTASNAAGGAGFHGGVWITEFCTQ